MVLGMLLIVSGTGVWGHSACWASCPWSVLRVEAVQPFASAATPPWSVIAEPWRMVRVEEACLSRRSAKPPLWVAGPASAVRGMVSAPEASAMVRAQVMAVSWSPLPSWVTLRVVVMREVTGVWAAMLDRAPSAGPSTAWVKVMLSRSAPRS